MRHVSASGTLSFGLGPVVAVPSVVVHRPCFYHPSENITYNISHNTHSVPILQIRPLVSRAQARLILRQSCPPHPGRTMRIGQPIRGPSFSVPGEYADQRTNCRPDSGAHVNCLTSSVASCRISRRSSQQVTQH